MRAVLTDNGPAYHSTAFARAYLTSHVRHNFNRLYNPQTNGGQYAEAPGKIGVWVGNAVFEP